MTKITYVPDNGKMRIPTREEFSRYYAGEIYESDFSTEYHSEGQSVNRVAASIAWTIKNEQRRNQTNDIGRFKRNKANTNE